MHYTVTKPIRFELTTIVWYLVHKNDTIQKVTKISLKLNGILVKKTMTETKPEFAVKVNTAW